MGVADPQPAETGPKAKVFISYSRKDLAFVDRLADGLAAHDITPSIDRSEIYAFEDWWKRIEALIAAADTVIFVLSPDAVASDICRKEVDCARRFAKRFAPIVCRSVAGEMEKIPPALADLNFIFFDQSEAFDASLHKLVEALESDIGWIRYHTEYGLDAAEWEKAKRPNGLLLRSPRLEEAERWIATRPANAPAPAAATQAFILASRKGASRRRNLLTGSLSAGLVLALGLAGVALSQRSQALEQKRQAEARRQEAVAQRQLAEKNFDVARKTVDGLIANIAQGLKDTKGMRKETVRTILSTVKNSLDQLSASAPKDKKILLSRIVMLHNFSVTYQRVGDYDAALGALSEAIAIAKALSGEHPGFLNDHTLTVLLHTDANIRLESGDIAASFLSAKASLEISQKNADAHSNSTQQELQDVLIDEATMGDVQLRRGMYKDAMSHYNSAILRGRTLLAKFPSDDSSKRLSDALQRAGIVEKDKNEQLARFEESLKLSRRASSATPDDADSQRNVGVGAFSVCLTENELGRIADAKRHCRESLEIHRALAEQDPGNAQYQRDISLVLSKLGQVAIKAGDLQVGLKYILESLSIAKQLMQKSPHSALYMRDVALALREVGKAYHANHDEHTAILRFQESVDLLKRYKDADSNSKMAARDLMLGYGFLSDELETTHDYYRALDARQAHAELLKNFYKSGLYGIMKEEIARDLGNASASAILSRNYQKGFDLADEALAFAPQLKWLYLNKAHSLMLLGRAAEARSIYLSRMGEHLNASTTWKKAVLNDFDEFRKIGIQSSLMAEITASANASH